MIPFTLSSWSLWKRRTSVYLGKCASWNNSGRDDIVVTPVLKAIAVVAPTHGRDPALLETSRIIHCTALHQVPEGIHSLIPVLETRIIMPVTANARLRPDPLRPSITWQSMYPPAPLRIPPVHAMSADPVLNPQRRTFAAWSAWSLWVSPTARLYRSTVRMNHC